MNQTQNDRLDRQTVDKEIYRQINKEIHRNKVGDKLYLHVRRGKWFDYSRGFINTIDIDKNR